ncbi:Fic family protein [Verrucomicrobiota bacterium]
MGLSIKKNLPEIVFGSSNKAESQRISRGIRAGDLRKLIPRIYTSNLVDSNETIVKRNLYPILGKLFPGALLSHRSALEGGPTETGHIFLTYKYSKRVCLPGFTIHLLKGVAPLEDDMPFVEGMFLSSPHRAFMENLQISRSRSSAPKVLAKEEIENRLDQICGIKGTKAMNQLRDKAREVSQVLNMENQFQKLNNIIAALLRTRPSCELSSAQARATSLGVPYDPVRLDCFNQLFSALTQSQLPAREQKVLSQEEIRTLAFLDAYFSNYIEGTEFEISEAYDIIYNNKVPVKRPEDAHDILGTFRLASNHQEMDKVPETFDQFVDLLKSRHFAVMEARPAKLPGEFKDKPNRAGDTHFVTPELVSGTLLKGFEMSRAVQNGIKRAIFIMFLIAEVHPFVDGNGRIARIMMNSELIHSGLCCIIIPTVFRDDYLLALRALSRSNNAAPLIKALDFAQKFSSKLDYSSYSAASSILESCNAFNEPQSDSRLVLPGAISS